MPEVEYVVIDGVPPAQVIDMWRAVWQQARENGAERDQNYLAAAESIAEEVATEFPDLTVYTLPEVVALFAARMNAVARQLDGASLLVLLGLTSVALADARGGAAGEVADPPAGSVD